MSSRLAAFLFSLLVCSWLSVAAHASELSDQLARGDQLLIMRHARAPGIGDPAGFSLNDCATQRNLNEEGREQARKIGNWLRQQGVESAVVASSPWCRTTETAALLGFGTPQVEDGLASFFNDPAQAGRTIQRLERYLRSALPAKGSRALILVTHDVNIARWTGESVASGEMVLVRVDASGKPVSHKVYARPD
ncbi:histidine phosphatase family protein [Herbaspirillum sp. DW155]|uniref:histidine phosphatase family protein n=1 Tax=Herbaspirillum sp. DW155 TaxID=3095609 RepID=UPI0030885906|nr:histidine phosphatase family protein [Herbaspirillum sp. DW155]